MPCDVVFILGAKDPEMKLIREILQAAHCGIVPATRDGKRVYPGNAYQADPPRFDPRRYAAVYAVECGWHGEPGNVVHVDHHRPGDPGYGQPPDRYFSASSIGQVFALVSGLLADAGRGAELDALRTRFWHEASLAAAADHCLGAACQGRCPGIDPDELMDWCIRRRAAFQRRAVAEVAAEVRQSRALIRALAIDGLADLRGLPGGTLPEAPQAACCEGIAVLTEVTARDGRQKVGLLGATPERVRAFLSGAMVPGLVDRYGDPARGFAGGYVPCVRGSARG